MLPALFALILAGSPTESLKGPIFPRPKSTVIYSFLRTTPALAEQCTGTAPAGSNLTTTRALGTATCINENGLLTTMTADTPRIERRGLLVERSAINLALQARDLSNASWTKASLTCVKNATGVDGVSNSASTCTASAGNGTVLQGLTTSGERTTSVIIKRTSGTGNIDLTRNNGTNWTTLSATNCYQVAHPRAFMAPNSTERVRCSVTSTVNNPVIGLRFVTSGNAAEIDYVQDEAGDYATSPIATTTTNITRNADSVYGAIPTGAVRSMSAIIETEDPTVDASITVLSAYQDANNKFFMQRTGVPADSLQNLCYWRIAGVHTFGSPWTFLPHTFRTGGVPTGCSYDGANIDHQTHGFHQLTAAAITPPSAFTRIYLAGSDGAGQEWGGHISDVCVGRTASACNTDKPGADREVVWIGDSLTEGIAPSAPTRPPGVLNQSMKQPVYNYGVGGSTATQCLTRWRTFAAGKGYDSLVLFCGVNSLIAGGTATSIYAELETLMNEARAEGLRVTPVLIAPWKNFVSWNAPAQAQTDALNALLVAYCTANSLTCVSTATLGGEGGDANVLLAAYDSGDHLHYTAAGSTALAVLVGAASP